jgi:hypothetical protein
MTVHRKFVKNVLPMYDELLAVQGGGCAICGATPKTRRLHIDHDHRTMRLRGLLCHRCNRRLDSTVTVLWLEAATAYLTTPPATLLVEP